VKLDLNDTVALRGSQFFPARFTQEDTRFTTRVSVCLKQKDPSFSGLQFAHCLTETFS
jgi:hypothetical protein